MYCSTCKQVVKGLLLSRPAHKKECKQQAQKQLRVSISSKPPGGGKGGPASWVGLSQGDVSKWAAGQVNGTGRGKAPPEAKAMTGNVSVKHEKLVDVKIQVGSQARCMSSDAGAAQVGNICLPCIWKLLLDMLNMRHTKRLSCAVNVVLAC